MIPEAEESGTILTELAGAVKNLTAQIAIMGGRMGQFEERLDNAASESAQAEVEESSDGSDEETATTAANNDIPSLRELRRNYEVGKEVNRRLAEMDFEDETDGVPRQGARRRGKRSGAARTVQDTVIRDIDWPHFHIYAPPGAEPMTFPRLSMAEFVYGFQLMVDQPDARLDRQIMWDILKGMMEDATEYPWQNVRDFYWVVGSHVENARLDWTDTAQIQKLRAKHAQKHEITVKKQAAQEGQSEKLRYCGLYQKGTCPEKADHAGQKHMCAYCFRAKRMQCQHPESECRRKAVDEQPKNVKGGE